MICVGMLILASCALAITVGKGWKSILPAWGGDVETEFQGLYESWRESLDILTLEAWRPKEELYDDNEFFHKLVALGPEALPCMMVAAQRDRRLLYIMEVICKRRLEYHLDRAATKPGNPVYVCEDLPGYGPDHGDPKKEVMWLYWWNEVREQTPELFAGHYEEWKALRDEGKTEEAAKSLESIKNLGIDALPSVMEAVAAGDKDMVPVAAYLADVPWITGEKASDAMTRDECVAWWNANREHYVMPPFEKIVVEEKAGSDDETTAAQ